MSWQLWADELRRAPQQAVADLLRGFAQVSPFERAAPHEFLLAVLPRSGRRVNRQLLGESPSTSHEADTDLPALLDQGLVAWLQAQRQAPQPPARKLSAYAAQVCEALQWPLYFDLPRTLAALRAERARWLPWLGSLSLSAYRDPEFDYWQALAAQQPDDGLQFFWQQFVHEAGRTRSARYLNLGLLALAAMPLIEDDSLRNLRLQMQALVSRYQRRSAWGAPAQQELANGLRSVMARNLSMGSANYRTFLQALLAPLGDGKTQSVLALLGLAHPPRGTAPRPSAIYKLQPPGQTEETNQAVDAVRRSNSLAQAWNAIRPLLSAHEEYLHKSGDAYYFVRNLDRCARILLGKYSLRDPEVQPRLFQWIHLALRLDADDPHLWMLWELALRKAEQPQRAQWVLWEMTRRFPEHLPCRVELAQLLAKSASTEDQTQAHRLLQQVLQLDPDHLHAHSTLAKLARDRGDWPNALLHAQDGLRIDPSNPVCAVLLASTWERRQENGDLPMAIEFLQNFVTRYHGNVIAENYLRTLNQRQQSAKQGKDTSWKDDAEAAATEPLPPETDSGWLAFAKSLRAGTAPATVADAERVLPLPQALHRALTQQQWDAELLDAYDTAAQQEFPLETRLWRYLLALHAEASGSGNLPEINRTRQAVRDWIETEQASTAQPDEFWLHYISKHWNELEQATAEVLPAGSDWLDALLARHRPLPAPLMA
ncbi:hypothetical protein KIH07_21635 [Hydrogenophaga taeniospiralis]|uniref:tetratricopeptide repeat protein n=1 Tax=Hydrogenophaga taeniospiralis TaxID=65656 RepID=UPI001CF9689B|nr:hypothetical protein [Hydrogenophaga taeniospiralis]MCB4366346.1 hypothetical protein [Hydrogenophaga taeniospiralis]